MKITHPRFGEVEILEESILFYRIEHPDHGYAMWFPKTDMEVAEAKTKKPNRRTK